MYEYIPFILMGCFFSFKAVIKFKSHQVLRIRKVKTYFGEYCKRQDSSFYILRAVVE